MKVHIKNTLIQPIIEMMFNWKLKGRYSRHRSKFIEKLSNQLKVIVADEEVLVKEYSHLDEEGNPKKRTENDTEVWDSKDEQSFLREKNELWNEEFVIDGGNNETMLKTVKELLDNSEEEFSGQEAILYNYLCDQFEQLEVGDENDND